MDQVNGENPPEATPNFPVKRRRGRPRKDPSQGVTRRVSTQVPPGPDRVNGTRSLQLDAIEDTYNGIVGQPVTGVVESSFDAGYLLSVRIGNSGTNFRGVVFKPGHYVPISPENDVAPHVQMIRRNEISLPLVNQAHGRGRHRRSRGRNARHLPTTPQLETANMAGHVPLVPYPSGQYVDPGYVQAQPGASNLQPPSMSQVENGAFYQVGESVDLMDQCGPSSAPYVAENEGGAADGEESGEESDDVDEPLDATPLQAIHTYSHSQQSQPVHMPVETRRVGKMTELLQAVQEKVPRKPLLGAGNLMPRTDDAQA